jgi:hypothetical protein
VTFAFDVCSEACSVAWLLYFQLLLLSFVWCLVSKLYTLRFLVLVISRFGIWAPLFRVLLIASDVCAWPRVLMSEAINGLIFLRCIN